MGCLFIYIYYIFHVPHLARLNIRHDSFTIGVYGGARYVARMDNIMRQCVIYIGRTASRPLQCRRLGWVDYVARILHDAELCDLLRSSGV